MYRFLCVVALFAVSASALNIREAGTNPNNVNTCRARHPISPAAQKAVASLRPHDIIDIPETRCYGACLLIQTMVLSADGTINADRMKYLFQKQPFFEKVMPEIRQCTNQRGASVCETAYKTHVCLKSKPEFSKIYY